MFPVPDTEGKEEELEIGVVVPVIGVTVPVGEEPNPVTVGTVGLPTPVCAFMGLVWTGLKDVVLPELGVGNKPGCNPNKFVVEFAIFLL